MAPVLEHAADCGEQFGGCDDIGGCYHCGARPFCTVIDDDGFCRLCGADQGDDGTVGMHELVLRDLRAIKGIHPV